RLLSSTWDLRRFFLWSAKVGVRTEHGRNDAKATARARWKWPPTCCQGTRAATVSLASLPMNVLLGRLSVRQFRNHRETELELGRQVNCFIGPNGTGKTNLLDAVHYLAMCKSYFEPQDMHNVLHGEEWFMVKGTMEMPNGSDELSCAVRKGHRKVFTRNRKEYERLADHVGRFPAVMITPYDSQLVLEGSEVRRRFLDGL